MKLQTLSTGIGLLATGAIALTGTPVSAASFTAADAVGAGCVGQTTCTVNGFSLTASKTGVNSPEMTQKTEGGILGIGIAKNSDNLNFRDTANGDPSGGEIDRDETLKVLFPSLGSLDALQLSFMYQPGVFADKVFEKARITALDAAGNLLGLFADLTVTGNTTAVTTSGGVSNVSPSVVGGGGSYLLSNLFGGQEIGGFAITALSNGSATSFRNSDFTLSAVSTTAAVPEPATLLGLGVVGGLMAASRRNKKSV
ncbi:PEP-CTERM sorting domain-containing protein [Oscillatoria sp. FACHB-1406]|uniref:PEP-CTERM sorting domain-containing protein n=1 Tax=Oscillatoria sp. FACHB-1406 TaxID=2692846 RepID=UPI0016851ED3|nr:PEP-CTERM sorting domain-containing protein [Oscillatoria sp. FACHB-1406]MBD2577595.1 PEP-CTERM sorting domain-containing protein [Oscillatoria sp. FACHB-1406]